MAYSPFTSGSAGQYGADGALLIAGGSSLASGPLAAATLLKVGVGRVAKVVVLITAAASSTINDCATTGAAAAGNTLLNIPASTTVGTVFTLEWPYSLGLVVVPGAGITLGVSYS